MLCSMRGAAVTDEQLAHRLQLATPWTADEWLPAVRAWRYAGWTDENLLDLVTEAPVDVPPDRVEKAAHDSLGYSMHRLADSVDDLKGTVQQAFLEWENARRFRTLLVKMKHFLTLLWHQSRWRPRG